MWEMDYDTAASYWTEKAKDSVSMEPDALKERIDSFIKEHNTCALATASSDMVRCTPIEYNYLDGVFYLFSEGGLKFKALKENKRVGMAIYESYSGFGNLKSLQIEGKAEMIEPFSDEYMKLLKYKKIPVEAIKKMPHPMNLIKIIPDCFDYLDSDLKKDGFDIRQHIQEMEDILDKAIQKMDALEECIAGFEEFQSEIQKLEKYYTSQQWKDDFAMDEKGELPANMKRGILSEDGIYNMLERNKELLERIKGHEAE